MRLGAALLLVSAVAAGCRSSSLTQVVVEIDTDLAVPAEIDGVSVTISTLGPKSYALASPGALPVRLGLVPGGKDDDAFTIFASATVGGSPLSPPLDQSWQVAFVPGKVMLLRVFLSRLCQERRTPCVAGVETCDASDGTARCASRVATLVPYPAAPRDGGAPDGGDARADMPGGADAGGPDVTPPAERGKDNGVLCNSAGECASGRCVDGVCCESACTDACKSCNVTGQEGKCAPDPQGTACGDGAGCSSDGVSVVPAGSCDGAGACVPGTPRSCAPFRCGNGACQSTCTTSNDCVNAPCTGGSCGARPKGSACTATADCQPNLYCVNNVCCDSVCVGTCRACNVRGQEGTCTMLGAGTPAPACPVSAVSTCGTDGTCDGSGGCRNYPPGTPCGQEGCVGSTYRTAASCAGPGQCASTQPPIACDPYACAGQLRCGGGSCTSHAECSANAFCASLLLGGLSGCTFKLANNSPCVDPVQCQSNRCDDNLCGARDGASCQSSTDCRVGCCGMRTPQSPVACCGLVNCACVD